MTNMIASLEQLLGQYAYDTENAELNFQLATLYRTLGQTASSVTYFLRAAERTENKLLAYECLLKIAECFDAQQNRGSHVVGVYNQAICLMPERPEAHFLLSRFNEKNHWYMQAYVAAEIGLNVSRDGGDPLRSDVGYPGRYGFIFEKAVAAWWWGRPQESRDLFLELRHNHVHEMQKIHIDSVADNLSRIGSGPDTYTYRKYNRNLQSRLRFQFKNLDHIEQNFSQLYQDMFVLSMLDGKKNGTYLEIGSAFPFWGNNTALLETQFGWTGSGIEFNEKFIGEYNSFRKNPVLHADARSVNYVELCSKISRDGKTIDYLQVDCEPPKISFEILKKLPFDLYKFAVITFEHDHYVDLTDSVRRDSREFLISKGYQLVGGDISCDHKSSQEDWWVHPELVDKNIIDRMTSITNGSQSVESYMLSGVTSEKDSSGVEEPIFYASRQQKPTVWVVDNFYDRPDQVREFALKQSYVEGGFGRGFIGRRTEQQFLFPDLKPKFEQIMGRPITKWQEHGMNGRFQIAWSGEPLVYHCDSQRWGGMLYLTPNAPYQCGTTLFAHKQTRARTYYDSGWDAAWLDIPGDPHLDRTPFEPVDVMGNVYNRLVIFDASCIHSASEYFGTVKENARLWQMFFFD